MGEVSHLYLLQKNIQMSVHYFLGNKSKDTHRRKEKLTTSITENFGMGCQSNQTFC